jgi:hypothetical protein
VRRDALAGNFNPDVYMVPDWLLIRLLLGRGFILWLGVRLIFALIGFALYGHLPTAFGPITVLFIVGLTGVLVFVDQRRRGEVDLFGNLGISRTVMVTLAAVPALAAEVAISVALQYP